MPSLMPDFRAWNLSQGLRGVRRVSSKGGTESGQPDLTLVRVPGYHIVTVPDWGDRLGAQGKLE